MNNNRITGFDLSDRHMSIEDKLTHWKDWEVAKFETYAADLRQALDSLKNRPKPDDCAGRLARERLSSALEVVESRLAGVNPAPVEAARSEALKACQELNESVCASNTAATVSEQMEADASVKVAQKMQAARWGEFMIAATAARLPLVSSMPLHEARGRSQRAQRLDDIVGAQLRNKNKASDYVFGYLNTAVEVAAAHAKDAARDLDSFVWDVVSSSDKQFQTDDALDVVEVFLGEALRRAGLDHDVPQVFDRDAAE